MISVPRGGSGCSVLSVKTNKVARYLSGQSQFQSVTTVVDSGIVWVGDVPALVERVQ